MIKIILMLFCLMLLCCACSNLNVGVAPVLKAGAAAATGYAAYEIAPDDWTQSEKTVGEIVEGKITKDKAEAYDAGFASGRAYGARRQYEIIQQMQKSAGARGRTKVYAIPTPSLPGVNQVEHDVYLEVQE